MATETENEDFRSLPAFPPSIWGSTFASLPPHDSEFETYTKEVEVLKEQVKHMLMLSTTNLTVNIEFINLLCRLGVSYHFESEIDDQLNHLFNEFQNLHQQNDFDLYTVSLLFRILRQYGYMMSCGVSYHFECEINDQLNHLFNEFQNLYQQNDFDLYTIALLFRILRQYGYMMSCDVFKKFKNNNEEFNKNIANDVKGLLNLYEASFLCIHGEDVLDEAREFTKKHLEILIEKSTPNLVNHIRKSLSRPFHHGVERIEALHYISFYEKEELQNETLLKFAKLDYNRLQLLYRKELALLSRWWKDLNLTEKLPYVRDRIVEAYFWMLGCRFEPQYSYARLIGSKHGKLVSIVDDTYDSYGTLKELDRFTVALQRGTIDAIDQLPNYMKTVYKTFSDVFGETENHENEGIRYKTSYAKEKFQKLAGSYLVEAQWLFDNEYVPSFDEYMKNGLITAAMDMVALATMIGMKDLGITDYEWIKSNPKILQAMNVIGRLMNDAKPHEVEYKYTDCPKGLKSYMNEYGVSKEEAIERILKMCANAWKDINEAFMKPTTGSRIILKTFLNNARVANFIYTSNDIYTYPSGLKDVIASLFIHQLPL